MRTFLVGSFLFVLTLAGCQLSPEQAARVSNGAGVLVGAIDSNHDGIVTNGELRGAKNDPMAWIAGLLGLLGVVGGAVAKISGSKTQGEVDELYDRTHAPIALTAKPA